MITRDPLTGPFPTGLQITDYRDQPGYAKRLPDVTSEADTASRALARLERKTPR